MNIPPQISSAHFDPANHTLHNYHGALQHAYNNNTYMCVVAQSIWYKNKEDGHYEAKVRFLPMGCKIISGLVQENDIFFYISLLILGTIILPIECHASSSSENYIIRWTTCLFRNKLMNWIENWISLITMVLPPCWCVNVR